MASFAHLSSGRLNLSVLRDAYRKELLECIDRCSGSKGLVWDESLTSPLGLIAEYSLLQEHDVEKMFQLSTDFTAPGNLANIIFVVRPRLELMGRLADAVKRADGDSRKNPFRADFHILFVPRKTVMCEQRLKDLSVHGSFSTISEFSLDLFPIDTDLLSMETDSFKDCYIHNDYSSLFSAAKGLMTLQALYGVIPNIYGKGQCSKHLCDLLMRMRREVGGVENSTAPQIDNLLLIDRNVDLISPLLTPLTYEALIDEIYKIDFTNVVLPGEKFARQEQQQGQPQARGSLDPPPETKKLILNHGEELFAEMAGLNFNAVGPLLSRRTKAMSSQYDERHAAKTVADMKQFVSKLPKMQAMKQSVSHHTSVAELLKEFTDSETFRDNLRVQQEFVNGLETDKAHPFIEDCIAKEEPLEQVLRLLCLQCVCNSGFKPKLLEYYRREIIQTYGYEQMLTLTHLETAGLLYPQAGARFYPTIRKTLGLVEDDVNEQNPTSVSYVFSGFAPLSVRLTQFLTQPGWRVITEALGMLPGPKFEEVQETGQGRRRRASLTSMGSSLSAVERKTTLVFFVGGVTYAEIAALRFLSKQGESPVEYVIGATKIINSNNLLTGLAETLKPAVLF